MVSEDLKAEAHNFGVEDREKNREKFASLPPYLRNNAVYRREYLEGYGSQTDSGTSKEKAKGAGHGGRA